MSTKAIAQDLPRRPHEDATRPDIARETEFVAGVRQGLAELDRDERIPLDEIAREMPSWVIRQPSPNPLGA